MEIDIRKIKTGTAPSLEIKKEPGSYFDFLNKEIVLFGKELGDKKKERFYSEFSILLSAGVDIKTALELVVEQQNKAKDKQLFNTIKEIVVSGGSLSGAIEQSGKFSAYEYFSLKIGEESGKMAEVLNDLTKFFNGKIKQKRQVINALAYPVVVLITAFGAIFFMMKFVVPMFADVFKRFKTDLPPLTKLIINASDFFSQYGFFIFLCVFLALLFLYTQKSKDWFRSFFSSVILRVPLIGEIMRKVYLARFCHAMHLLTSAKTPLVNALDLVKKMVGFYPIETSLISARQMILDGETLHGSLSKFRVYTKRMISLIKVAEEVNKLEMIFEKLSKQFTDEVEHQTSLISSLLEPLIIIFLGVLVAVILVAMYLPLFKLSTSVGF
ncbi:MAG: type II secretion system F family protein [Bacteroidia bacterium]